MSFNRFGTSTSSNSGFGGFAKPTQNTAFGFNTTSTTTTGFGNFGNTPGGFRNTGFGATPSGGLFGGNPAGGGGFNATSTAGAFGNASGSVGFGAGGGFGSNQPAGGTPFGSSTTPGFGGFGSNTSAAPGFGFSTSQASVPFGFGFSQPSAANAGSFGFGGGTQTSQPSAANTVNFGFGGGAQISQPSTNAGSFGFGGGTQTSQPSGFGQFGLPQQTTSKPSGFGLGIGTQSNIFGMGGAVQTSTNMNSFRLGGTQQFTQNIFGNTSNQTMQLSAPTQTPMDRQQQITPYDELVRIINSWDPNSSECKFQSYFYNMVHPDEVQFYTPPSNMPQNLWNEAQFNNPDRTILVPVRVCGFEDIKKRLEVQEEITAKAIAKFKEYGAKLEEMERKHSLETLVRIEERKRKHIELTQRVIKLMRQIQVLRLKGTLIRADEETLKGRLEDIKQRSQRPLRKLETLKTQYNVTKVQWGSREPPVIHKFNAVDENQLENITKVLGAEQTGIVHDIGTLKKDSKDIDIIIRSFNGVPDTKS